MSAAAVSPVLIPERKQTTNVSQQSLPQDEASVRQRIAQLAYSLWENRGCPENSADVDWLEAERQMRGGAAV